ncbi:MAG: HAD family phosphatase [Chlorobiota bacterium]|nr:HAD family phosphatase [Chlorobiota bacterium]QQS67605.1 MAG: HAD family phosphatase [Chlorobiota bacterium]
MFKPIKKIFSFLTSPESRISKIRLIACDLDGTLLNGVDMIGKDTAYMIKKIQNLGIPFIIITRRHHSSVLPYLEDAHLSLPIVSLEGSTFFVSNDTQVIVNTDLDPEFMIDIIQEVQLNKIVKLCVVTVDKFYVNNDDIELPVYHEHWNIERFKFSNYIEINNKILELIIVGDYFSVNSILKYIESKMKSQELKLRMYELKDKLDSWVIEVRSFNSNKEKALVQIASYYGVKMNEIVGIGDYYNDINFCKEVGFVVALNNAVKELKAIADFITTNDFHNEGINEFLEYFLNIHGVEHELKILNKKVEDISRRRSR